VSEADDLGSSRERSSLFLLRLIPPRADFAQTMTPDEQHAMAGHQEYWQRLLSDGYVVVYGPVADPEGVWGMGVLRAESLAQVLEIGNNDPSVATGVNTFEVFEIMGGVTG
jgi:uncharacterized protein YciI